MHMYGTTQGWTSGSGDRHQRGDVHAVDERGESACGLKRLAMLHEPPRPWQSDASLRHCPVCIAALATPSDVAPEARITPTNVAR